MLLAERYREWFVPKNFHYLQGAAHRYCFNMHTSLVVQESIAYMRDRDSEVFLACLDTRKAFDTVWHEGLFHKLYQAGINGKLWRILWKWYRCSEGVVLLSGCSSTPYHVYQGVRQGGVSSTNLCC